MLGSTLYSIEKSARNQNRKEENKQSLLAITSHFTRDRNEPLLRGEIPEQLNDENHSNYRIPTKELETIGEKILLATRIAMKKRCTNFTPLKNKLVKILAIDFQPIKPPGSSDVMYEKFQEFLVKKIINRKVWSLLNPLLNTRTCSIRTILKPMTAKPPTKLKPKSTSFPPIPIFRSTPFQKPTPAQKKQATPSFSTISKKTSIRFPPPRFGSLKNPKPTTTKSTSQKIPIPRFGSSKTPVPTTKVSPTFSGISNSTSKKKPIPRFRSTVRQPITQMKSVLTRKSPSHRFSKPPPNKPRLSPSFPNFFTQKNPMAPPKRQRIRRYPTPQTPVRFVPSLSKTTTRNNKNTPTGSKLAVKFQNVFSNSLKRVASSNTNPSKKPKLF
jgi:hypothetical protein